MSKVRYPSSKQAQAQSEFYYWVGVAITQWADIDARLFVLCWYCLGAAQQKSAIVYYRTPTVDARLTLTDELVRAVFPKPERKNGGHNCVEIKEWAKIVAEIRDALAVRRKIAHYPVSKVISPIFDKDKRSDVLPLSVTTEGTYQVWLEFFTSQGEAARTDSRERGALDVADLRTHIKTVSDLSSRLLSFRFQRLLPQLGEQIPPDAPPLKDLIAKTGRSKGQRPPPE